MTTQPSAALIELARRQEGLVSATQCDAHGVTAHVRGRLCRRGVWRRVVRGVFDTTPDLRRRWPARRRQAALVGLLRYGPDAVAVGTSALTLLGVEGLPATVVSEVALGPGQSRGLPPARASETGPAGRAVRVRQFDVGAQTMVVAGFKVVRPAWALAQAVPELPRRHAIAVMDSALNKGLVGENGLEEARRLARGRRRVARTHGWWQEADGRAESPLETFGRLDCADNGVAPDALQVEIVDDHGLLLGRGDMGWRCGAGSWLLAEFDGREFHEDLGALLHDRYRQNEMQLEGRVRMLRFTYRDLAFPGQVAGTVRRALTGRPS
ncbi:hypothetical protein [Georgenia sp. AZ-5]|uniref:hypothetical protein n=1 Tax=Georgenia sp. AZ-5 TaxID=3367526 RepID=UPI003754235F